MNQQPLTQENIEYLERKKKEPCPSFMGGPPVSDHILMCRESLAAFVQATVPFELHEWQWKHLCPLIERLAWFQGVRQLVHAPRQYGKSIICSKRFPAWCLGRFPLKRFILAGYNEEHAVTQFATQVRDLMMTPFYKECFPHEMCQIAKPASANAFSTVIRSMLLDGQDSVVATGLLSGYTGKGLGPGDILIIDDPYASPEAARSKAINEKVWRWWHEGMEPRIHPYANVLVMYHRYHDDDLAGRLLKEGYGVVGE